MKSYFVLIFGSFLLMMSFVSKGQELENVEKRVTFPSVFSVNEIIDGDSFKSDSAKTLMDVENGKVLLTSDQLENYLIISCDKKAGFIEYMNDLEKDDDNRKKIAFDSKEKCSLTKRELKKWKGKLSAKRTINFIFDKKVNKILKIRFPKV